MDQATLVSALQEALDALENGQTEEALATIQEILVQVSGVRPILDAVC